VNPEIDGKKVPPMDLYPVQVIHGSGKLKKRLDLVFLPEGYSAGEMDKFVSDCGKFTQYLFDTDPYGEYRDLITVRAVLAHPWKAAQTSQWIPFTGRPC